MGAQKIGEPPKLGGSEGVLLVNSATQIKEGSFQAA